MPAKTLNTSFNLKSFIPSSFLYCLIIAYFFCIGSLNTLDADEPIIAKYESTISNEAQRFSIGTYSFLCKPYGVITLESLYNNATTNPICKQNIQRFFTRNPLDVFFVKRYLYSGQYYHVEFKNEWCVVYIKGRSTLSDLLLSHGLGIMKPNFRDKEFMSLFDKAQRSAKDLKLGIWKDNIIKNCLGEIYK